MDMNVGQKNLEQSLTAFAKKISPAVEAILKTVKPEDLTSPEKVAAVAVHATRTVFSAINLNVNAKVIIPSLSIMIGRPKEKPEDPDPEVIVNGALPMIVSQNPPGFGDAIMMDQRIPQQFQPAIISRVHYPFNGGHMMIGLGVWVENKEDAEKCWTLYEKFLGGHRIEIEPETPNEPPEAEGQAAVPPAGN